MKTNLPKYSSLCKGVVENIFSTYRNESQAVNQDEIENHVNQLKALQDILNFSKTGFIIVDNQRGSYLYCSPNMQEVVGQASEDLLRNGPMFGGSIIYEKDLPDVGKCVLEGQALLASMPLRERIHCRLSIAYRVVHPDGHLIQIIQNVVILKWGDSGKALLELLILSDISAYKSNPDVIFNITRMEDDGTRKILVHRRFSETENKPLTAVELSIIGMISNGLSVTQLADHFSRSPNTIRNHKKAIMAKLGCSNSAQMVTLARLYGFCNEREVA